jgi:hypothetical protein
MSHLAECVLSKNLVPKQVSAMVEKYPGAHPERWHESMPQIVLYTLTADLQTNASNRTLSRQ